MNVCSHPTVWGGLCVECGADVTSTSPSAATATSPSKPSTPSTATASSSSSSQPAQSAAVVPVVGGDGRARFSIMHGDERLVVTAEEAARLHEALSERLMSARRLILVLDLDLTLIHATTARELQDTTNRLGKTIDFSGETDMYEFVLSARDPNTFYIKLRPHLRSFMATASQFFEIHMYTMGTKAYAERVGQIIDPDGAIFQGRILSRDACGDATSKDLKRLFPAGDQLAVVIDDRSDVWRTSDGVPTQNLLQIPPFRFFPVFHELNALPQDKHEDYHDSNRVQAAADVRLNQMMTVLLDLHARFFAHYDATHKIKSIGEFLREKRRGVLRGTRIMFSSVYGRDDRSMKAVILQMAVQHGADCATELDDVGEGEVELPADVTHVVARFDATSKARAALKTEGVYLVTVDWFMESVVRLQRLPEQDFPVGKRAVIVGEPRKPFTPIVDDAVEDDDDNAGNDDDDDDDDESSDNDGDDDVPEEKAKPTKIAVVKPAEVLGSAAAEDPDGWHDSEDDDDPFGASNAPTTMAIGALPPPKKARVEEPTPPEASAATTGREQSELDQLLDQL